MTGYIYILPALLIIALIILYPIISTVQMSFYGYRFTDPTSINKFVGFNNYIYLLTNALFWKSLWNNLYITGSSVAIQMVIGMIIALLLNEKFRGRGIVRGLILLPWVTPTFVAAFMFSWILDARFGIFNILLVELGILSEGYPFFTNLETVVGSVVLAYVWRGLPWVILVLLSGLQMVPETLVDAAKVDGANAWKRFWNVTVPSMKYIIVITVFLRTIWTFNTFDYLFLLTGGGPMNTTMTWPLQIYKTAFETFMFSRASAMGGILLVFMSVFMVLYLKFTSGDEEL